MPGAIAGCLTDGLANDLYQIHERFIKDVAGEVNLWGLPASFPNISGVKFTPPGMESQETRIPDDHLKAPDIISRRNPCGKVGLCFSR